LAGPALETAHDVAFHHLGRHAGVEGDDLHGRRVELRQQVRGHPAHGHHADHDHGQYHHRDQVGIA